MLPYACFFSDAVCWLHRSQHTHILWYPNCCCPGCSSLIKLWQNDSLKRNATGCWAASPVSKSLSLECHSFHFGREFQPAAFGLFTCVCRDINTLVCLHINSSTAVAVCGAESPAILKKGKQTLNVVMDVVQIRNRSKWKHGEWIQVEIQRLNLYFHPAYICSSEKRVWGVSEMHTGVLGQARPYLQLAMVPTGQKCSLTTKICIFSLLESESFGLGIIKRMVQCIWWQGHLFEIKKERTPCPTARI